MSNLERWFGNKKPTTFRELSKLEDSFERLMNDMLAEKSEGMRSFNFEPTCDVIDEGKNFLLKFDLPGVTKDQVKVEINKDQLTVSAERKEEEKHESKKKFVSEVRYGSFVRNFSLPGLVDEKKVDAKFENGVLSITVPKAEELHSK